MRLGVTIASDVLTGRPLRALALTHALDQLTIPIYFIDASGDLADANRAATSALQNNEWLVVTDRRLRANPKVLESRRAAELLMRLRRGSADSVVLTDPSGAQAVMITAPLQAEGLLELTGRVVGFVWIIPLETAASPAGLVGQLFSLTRAEMRLLTLLQTGADLRSIAARLNLSVHTIRNELKAIFRKTGRRSQADLMALTQRMSVVRVP